MMLLPEVDRWYGVPTFNFGHEQLPEESAGTRHTAGSPPLASDSPFALAFNDSGQTEQGHAINQCRHQYGGEKGNPGNVARDQTPKLVTTKNNTEDAPANPPKRSQLKRAGFKPAPITVIKAKLT